MSLYGGYNAMMNGYPIGGMLQGLGAIPQLQQAFPQTFDPNSYQNPYMQQGMQYLGYAGQVGQAGSNLYGLAQNIGNGNYTGAFMNGQGLVAQGQQMGYIPDTTPYIQQQTGLPPVKYGDPNNPTFGYAPYATGVLGAYNTIQAIRNRQYIPAAISAAQTYQAGSQIYDSFQKAAAPAVTQTAAQTGASAANAGSQAASAGSQAASAGANAAKTATSAAPTIATPAAAAKGAAQPVATGLTEGSTMMSDGTVKMADGTIVNPSTNEVTSATGDSLTGTQALSYLNVALQAYNTYKTMRDPNATTTDKVMSGVGLAGAAGSASLATTGATTILGSSTLASAVPFLNAAAGLYQGYKVAEYQSDAPSGGRRNSNSAMGGAAAGASVGTAIFPGIGTAVGAAVGAIAGLAGSYFGSSKGGGQMVRDGYRKFAKQNGLIDENYQGDLADGSKYDFGKDGSTIRYGDVAKMDGADETFSMTDAMLAGMGFQGKNREAMNLMFSKAAMSNAKGDKNKITENLKHFAKKNGVTGDSIQESLDKQYEEGDITENEYKVWSSKAKDVFGATKTPSATRPGQEKPPVQDGDKKPETGGPLRLTPEQYAEKNGIKPGQTFRIPGNPNSMTMTQGGSIISTLIGFDSSKVDYTKPPEMVDITKLPPTDRIRANALSGKPVTDGLSADDLRKLHAEMVAASSGRR